MRKVLPFLFCLLAAVGARADETIDQLSAAASLTGTEYVPIFQTANPAVRTTPSAIKTYMNGATSTWSAAQTFSNGDLLLAGSGSGAGTLEAPAAASTYVWTLPASTATLAGLGFAQTWTAAQTFTNSDLLLLGSSTGATTFTSANASGTSYTATVPANTGTIAELNLAQTWSAAQTFNNADLKLAGSSSGSGTLEAPAAASTYVWTLPAATANLGYQVGSITSGNCLQASGTAGGFADSGSTTCGGLTGLTINSTTVGSSTANYLLYTDGTKLQQETLGSLVTGNNGISVTGTTSITISSANTDTVHTTSPGSAAGNIGGEDDWNAGSLTHILATLSSGQTLFDVTTANALTINENSQTVIGCPLATTLNSYGFYGFSYNSAGSLTCWGFPGFGTIASGALMKFNDATGAATAGNLSGDVTTLGSLATTVAKVNGVAYGTSPSTNTVPVVTGSNAITYETVPVAAGGTNCTSASITCFNNITGFTTAGTTGTTSTNLVFSTSPTLVTPVLGTPSSGDASNLTNIPVANAKSGSILPAANGGAGTITGALKANGSGTVSQAACSDLSNGASGCYKTATIGWVGAVNPNNALALIIPANSTLVSLVGNVEVAVGSTATVSLNVAASGTACSAGTTVHSGSFNANGTAATNQTLTLTTTSVSSGSRLCLQTSGGSDWTSGSGVGGLTIAYTTP